MPLTIVSLRVLIIFSLIALCPGCSSTRPPQGALPFTIVLGSGGGFTGLYEGYVIDSTGRINQWRGRTFASAEFVAGPLLDDDGREEIQRIVAETGILSVEYRKSGNMISFVTFHRATGEHRISWNGVEPGPDVPAPAREFYDRLRGFLRDMEGKSHQNGRIQ